MSILLQNKEKKERTARRTARQKERELECVLSVFVRCHRWKHHFPGNSDTGCQPARIEKDSRQTYTQLFFTSTKMHTTTQSLSVSRVFRYTLAGKQFHKLTYKVEKVHKDMNKQTLQADCLLQLTP